MGRTFRFSARVQFERTEVKPSKCHSLQEAETSQASNNEHSVHVRRVIRFSIRSPRLSRVLKAESLRPMSPEQNSTVGN
jgi:hypothetical protein